MRCTCYCTASHYELPRLFQALQKEEKGAVQLYRDLIHIQIKEERRLKGDVFYFTFGAAVFWGFTEEEERWILQTIKEFEKEPLAKLELDEFTFSYGESMKIEEDEIILQNKSPLTKLSISYGLSQSVKLAVFEELIQKTIEHTSYLPKDLALKGKISLSRKEISQKMGELFIERNFINLNREFLDTPEYFWDYPELEPFYRRTAHYLDVGKRLDVLNKQLNVIHELFEILSNELNHQHSFRLEMIIIFLIVIEVLLGVFRDIFHLL
jgi:uncharacterized Rmd1/YagE family protein